MAYLNLVGITTHHAIKIPKKSREWLQAVGQQSFLWVYFFIVIPGESAVLFDTTGSSEGHFRW